MTKEEFFEELNQNILARAGAQENFTRSIFLEDMCSLMEQEGLFSGYDLTEHKGHSGRKQLAVDAWAYDSERSCLFLILADYRSSGQLESLTNTDINKQFRRLRTFVEASCDKNYERELEESDPVTQLAWLIHKQHQKSSIERIVLILVSNAILSSKVTELPEEYIGSYSTSYDIWDLGRIFRLEVSGKSRETVEMSFSDLTCGGLPCLPANTGFQEIQSYIVVMPGIVLANLYEEHGERLLEQNVRTFLQFRGKVNKGIRNTVVNEPQMFFSYNNGITATAESLVLSDCKGYITHIRNLQIVNGGQTTASIYNAHRKEKANLEAVYVQMKLSVIDQEFLEETVPKISQYANTQNKVSAADFFSNHEFHRRMEEFSRRIWAPQKEGSVEQTHWFYERARGQYANIQTNMTVTQKKMFLIQNPRKQMFTKTDLAKFILSFEKVPHEVSLGAQKAFSGTPRTKGFVKRIAEQWDRDNKVYNELWFKQSVAKAIVFKEVDSLVFRSSWYVGYKANIVTYSIAKFANMIAKMELSLDFLNIWEKQAVPLGIMKQFEIIAREVNEVILYPDEGITSNSSEWAKKLDCWERVRGLRISFLDEVKSMLINKDQLKENENDAIKKQKMQNGIHDQTYVVEKGSFHWHQLREWNRPHNILSPKELSILNIACSIPNKIPSDKQSKILIEAEARATQEGFYID